MWPRTYFTVLVALVHVTFASTDCDTAIKLERKQGPFQDTNIVERWYKVPYYELVDEAVSFQDCGTTYPVWGRGDFPEDGQEAEIAACVVSGTDDCSETWNITVKDCGEFDIYLLKPTKNDDQAYCFKYDDDDDDCEDDKHHGKRFHRCHRNHRRAILVIGAVIILALIACIISVCVWRKKRLAQLKRKETYKEDPQKGTAPTGPVVVVSNEDLPPKY